MFPSFISDMSNYYFLVGALCISIIWTNYFFLTLKTSHIGSIPVSWGLCCNSRHANVLSSSLSKTLLPEVKSDTLEQHNSVITNRPWSIDWPSVQFLPPIWVQISVTEGNRKIALEVFLPATSCKSFWVLPGQMGYVNPAACSVPDSTNRIRSFLDSLTQSQKVFRANQVSMASSKWAFGPCDLTFHCLIWFFSFYKQS